MNTNVVRNISELNQLELNALITDLVENKDKAYTERNKCVALIARMAIALGLTAGLWYHEGEEEGWGWIVSIQLPTGWADWHIHDQEFLLFEHLPVIEREWEDYTTEEKYQRVLYARFKDETTVSQMA